METGSTLEELAARIMIAEAALRFYADPKSYRGVLSESGGEVNYYTADVIIDCGKKARMVLGYKEKDKQMELPF